MRVNISPGTSYGGEFHYNKGGVLGLDFIKKSELAKPNEALISSNRNRVDPTFIEVSTVSYVPKIQGPKRLKIETLYSWKITNYNFTKDMVPTSDFGTIYLDKDVLYFIPNALGNINFVLAGRTFPLESYREYIEKPYFLNNISILRTPNYELLASNFVPVNAPDTHRHTDWEIYYDPELTQLFKSLNQSVTNLNKWQVSGFEINRHYYARVRFKGNAIEDISEWSDVLSFRTSTNQEVKISKPSVVYPSYNTSNVSVTPVITSSEFVINNWTDVHEATDWEISTVSDFSTLVASSYDDRINKTFWKPFSVPEMLPINTILYVRVRHRGRDFGWSEWSMANIFRTVLLVVNKPTMVFPLNASTDHLFSLVFKSSEFLSTGNLIHESTDWELSVNSDFSTTVASTYKDSTSKTSFQVTSLSPKTVFYLRVRHRSTIGLNSDWSNTVTFSTQPLQVYKPSITKPSNNSVDVDLNEIFTSSAFSANSEMNHLNSDWEISTNTAFTNLVYSAYQTNALERWVPGQLNINTRYYARVRHRSNTGLVSSWSDTVTFTTAVKGILKPTILKPSDKTNFLLGTVNFISSPFNQVGGIVHTATTWQISKNPNFTTIEASLENSSSKLLNWTSPELKRGRVYYARVRYLGSQNSVSGWSETVMFRIKGEGFGEGINLLEEIKRDSNGNIIRREFIDPMLFKL